MITQYNGGQLYTHKHLMNIVRQEIRMLGFIVSAHIHEHREEFYATIPRMIADGQIRYLEDAKKGLQWAGHAILDVQQGKNKGKSVIIVGEE